MNDEFGAPLIRSAPARGPATPSPLLVGARGKMIAGQSADLLVALVNRLFRGAEICFALKLWTGEGWQVGPGVAGTGPACFTLVFRSPAALRSVMLGRDPLRLAEAFFRGDLDIEGDFFKALHLKDHLHAIRVSATDRLLTWFTMLRLGPAAAQAHLEMEPLGTPLLMPDALHGRPVRFHSRQENKEAVRFHYDLSNRFYALWLDEYMVYSCAYFERPDYSLEEAQLAKMELICRKLLLQPGEHLLDIGCGWGALAIHAAQHHGVSVHAITLSQRQLDLAQQRVLALGLQERIRFELRDYRDLDEGVLYDKICSVGMFEHVGLDNLPAYFDTVQRVLKPGGLFLNHGITHDVEGWSQSISTQFINRYVFPDGELDTISNVLRVMERSGFEILDLESLRPHYALTLRQWVARLERGHAEASEIVGESVYRVWRLYMAASALEFESGEIGVYQVLASRRGASGGLPAVPLTRSHLMAGGAAHEMRPALASDPAGRLRARTAGHGDAR